MEKMILTKQYVEFKLTKKLLTVRIHCSLFPLQEFYCSSGCSSVQWTSFKTMFTRCITEIPQTRITKTRVEACKFTEKKHFYKFELIAALQVFEKILEYDTLSTMSQLTSALIKNITITSGQIILTQRMCTFNVNNRFKTT